MPHLRRSALTGLLLTTLSAATLTGCGFHYPTDRVNTISSGVNDRTGNVDALGIRVLATAKGEGRLIGSLSNNQREDASLDKVTSTAGITAAAFKPVVVAGRGSVNLANDSNIALTGDYTAGDFVPLDLTFSDGTTLSLQVPVVKPCYQYTEVPTPSAAPSESASPKAGDSAAGSAKPTASESTQSDTGDATFNCSDEAPEPGAEH